MPRDSPTRQGRWLPVYLTRLDEVKLPRTWKQNLTKDFSQVVRGLSTVPSPYLLPHPRPFSSSSSHVLAMKRGPHRDRLPSSVPSNHWRVGEPSSSGVRVASQTACVLRIDFCLGPEEIKEQDRDDPFASLCRRFEISSLGRRKVCPLFFCPQPSPEPGLGWEDLGTLQGRC